VVIDAGIIEELMVHLADVYSGLRREYFVVHQANDLSFERGVYVFRNALGSDSMVQNSTSYDTFTFFLRRTSPST
jgi:hypothetical protein